MHGSLSIKINKYITYNNPIYFICDIEEPPEKNTSRIFLLKTII